MVLTQLGHSPEEASDTPLGEARRGLVQLGVDRDTIDELIYTYPTEDILKQLAWLPERKARRPARFIVAAIEGNYGAPLAVRLRHAPSDAFVGTEDTVALPIPEQPEVDGVGREGHDA
jgi:hypothetical protein